MRYDAYDTITERFRTRGTLACMSMTINEHKHEL